MLTIILGTLLGGVLRLAIVLGVMLIRRRAMEAKPTAGPTVEGLDKVVSGEIEAAAWTWAVANGRPELAGLLARKVKQAWVIQEARAARVQKAEQS